METNAKKVLEAMPDYDDVLNLLEKMKELSLTKMKLENMIKATESSDFRTVMTDGKYFVNGKPVAVSYYENAYKFSGIDGTTQELRNQLSKVVAELEHKKAQFEVYKQMQDMYKSLVFAERSLV